MDYSSGGIISLHTGEIIEQLHLVNKKLKSINRNLAILTLLSITLTAIRYKDDIKKQVKFMKGE